MSKSKTSVTLKIIVGYIILTALAIVAFWVINHQVSNYTKITDIKNENNEKLFMVSSALTDLYEAESLTRTIIQTSDLEKLENYKAKIDSILKTIDNVSKISGDSIQIKKIDSIRYLVDSKNKNLEDLMLLHKQQNEKGLYETAIDELKKANESFGDPNYDERFKNLTPEFRKTIVNVIKLTKQDNAKRLTNQTVDSLAAKVKHVLAELEKRDKKHEKEILEKENTLLENDQIITQQLRGLLATIELNERNQYYSRLKASNEVLDKTTNTIILISSISLLITILFLFMIIKDVSRSQKYRNDLEAEKAYTESLLKMRESLINTVTHDLRSPLNTVIGYSDLLEKTHLNAKQKHYLDYLKKSSDYILHLVNDLLDLSKLDAGKMIIEELPFVPKKIIENTISNAIPVNSKKDIEIKVISTDALNRQYLSDPFRIKQVLTNLISNAYKFTFEGSITIQSEIDESDISDKKLIIKVKDTGIGISKKQQRYIFDEFTQGEDDTDKKYGGFGLGLAISKKIISLLNGAISLKSDPDVGSEFTISIPIKDSNFIIPEENDATNDILDFVDKKVLIVDDESSQLALTSEVVSMAGLSYDSCDNAIKALSMIRENRYDLILTDIQMPKMDGFELLDALKKMDQYKDIPVIALSGRINTSVTEYKDAGFSANLRKPYAPKELTKLIAETLNINTKEPLPTSQNKLLVSKNEQYSLEDLMLFAHGDTDSLHAILDTFYESTIENMNSLKSLIEKEDKDQIKKIAHKILPMFKQIKAKEIIPMLEELEHMDATNTSMLSLASTAMHKIKKLIENLKVTS